MKSAMDNIILQHWRRPFHRESRPDADFHGRDVGTVCGDEIDMYLFVEDGVIRDAFFDGDACTICLGMASLTTQHVIGQTIEEARGLTRVEVFQLAPDVEIPARRAACASVALRALQNALA